MSKSPAWIQDRIAQYDQVDRRDPLLQVLRRSRQYNVRIKSVDKRELIDVNDHKLIDFASCNYLSFDQEQSTLLPRGAAAAHRYGLHTSRARLMGYHELFSQIEGRLAGFLGVEETILFPNTTLAHIGIIPALMKDGDVIFLDKSAHATIYQGSQMARDQGAASSASVRATWRHWRASCARTGRRIEKSSASTGCTA
jgi:8-amino-7-oxononanoate synthase